MEVLSLIKREVPRVRLKINVKGIVQGVGFRPFIYRMAVANELSGYVRNRGDAGVEILIEGQEKGIKTFLYDMKQKKPTFAQIYEVTTTHLRGKNEYENFEIRKSSEEIEYSGSIIPSDLAICHECLHELRQPEDRRYDYFFITCTNCGPRYTIIDQQPYDRENTTMRDFQTCSFCQNQYDNPMDRRYHAQTVACPVCGPKVYLATQKGEPVEYKDPIREAGKMLAEGNILAIKGYGGFHVAAATTNDNPISRLRSVKHRSQKPFAIMARDVGTIRTFAEVSRREAELLASYARPIVLLNKAENYSLSNLIAPDLHNIGVMLPYTGLHYMLFDRVAEPGFVMTSANPPNQPIIKDNEEALKMLSETVDYFLFHDRRIAHRCDDSVVRVHGQREVFIRRSRGYAPAPAILHDKAERCVVGVGGELNNTACVLFENKAFISQHIGDVENVETRDFLENTIKHLVHLTNSKVQVVACDLHPNLATTRLADEIGEENSWQVVRVQHHFAHMAALMAEHGVKEIVGICCDGYGYGANGEAWGGEILLCAQENFSFKRLAHLEKQPLIGWDLATRYPLRVAAGILFGRVDVENWLLENKRHFPGGEQEIRILLHQLRRDRSMIQTTSCGRVLDAVAAILGVCYERTYEGEPSMKLEAAAKKGRDVLNLEPIVKGDTLNTTELLVRIFENREKHAKRDLAFCAHTYLANGLASLAVEKARENGIRTVGFSGGVASNEIFTFVIRKVVESAGLHFLVHEAVPPGDGGLSFGQAAAAGFSKI
jgi:hydrogenase maturation protein HypF